MEQQEKKDILQVKAISAKDTADVLELFCVTASTAKEDHDQESSSLIVLK